jgi:hypothetical protein
VPGRGHGVHGAGHARGQAVLIYAGGREWSRYEFIAKGCQVAAQELGCFS